MGFDEPRVNGAAKVARKIETVFEFCETTARPGDPISKQIGRDYPLWVTRSEMKSYSDSSPRWTLPAYTANKMDST